MRGIIVFITGLPSSGKTTLANRLAGKLQSEGYRVEVLDAYFIRRDVLGYGDTDFSGDASARIVSCMAWLARLLARNGVLVICSGVFPSRSIRKRFRRIVNDDAKVYTIYLKASIEKCMERDTKNLYKRYLRGEITRLPGLNPPYEEPEKPDLVINVDDKNVDEVFNEAYKWLKEIIQHRRTSSPG
jgi:adenylylsulfate kinase